MPTTIGEFGTLVLYLILIAAGYTFAVAVAAGRGRPRLLPAARWGMLATCALVLLATLALAYAFQIHDFRIRYVARYSDRSMPWYYLLASLWGGQDGSLLWWTFLLCGYTTACILWLKRRYRELQPWILATLASIIVFFGVLMLFAANPFSQSVAGVPQDGEGLNPLLQNYWMVIHPPCLYLGLIGASIPYAFVMAALLSGRLREEWIYAVRRWALVGWLFLTVGNLLGSRWSYEELGWGGYWAWDPVENASFMPWLTFTAFLHSVMIQERRGMMKVWNVVLMIITFLMTIFGTFLTRSGLIASVHSFARSEIGVYFIGFLVIAAVVSAALVVWRLPMLRSEHRLDSVLSREFAFLANNWILLAALVFVLGATTFPLISEAFRGEPVSVGAAFYNKWMAPLGLMLLLLTGIGPLIAWRKATGRNLLRSLAFPAIAMALVVIAHVFLGHRIGFPAVVASDDIYDTTTGRVLASIGSVLPVASFGLCGFVLASVLQEYVQGVRTRMRATHENAFVALGNLVRKARRRYGGYIVHIGIVSMFVGWTGGVYNQKVERTLTRGQSMQIGSYRIRYDHPLVKIDPNKRMTFVRLSIFEQGAFRGYAYPGKFTYRTNPDMPTTEVDMLTSARDDLYLVLGDVDPQTGVATLRAHENPLVVWIWIGGLILILGCSVCISPTASEVLAWLDRRQKVRDRSTRAVAAAAATVLLALSVLGWPMAARAQDSSTLHAGTVDIHSEQERTLFERLLCMCGTCARLPLSTCACGFAESARGEVRQMLAQGMSPAQIEAAYLGRYGVKALSVPRDRGFDRTIYIVPLVLIAAGAGLVGYLGFRWVRRGRAASATAAVATPGAGGAAQLDQRIDDEIRGLDDEG